MNTLQAELNRLYLEESSLIAPDGRVRALVLELARPADWNVLSAVWQGVQTDLELPAPAIAVNGIDGHQLWFSLAKPVSVVEATAFLNHLRLRYLSTVAEKRIGVMSCARVVPALQQGTGLWSAFVAPDLAAIFSAEPWLDLAPSPDAQANVLSRLESIKPAVFQSILESCTLQAIGVPTASVPLGKEMEPRQFLWAVMNDQAIELHLRIEAAKALLPYCESSVR